VTALAIIGAIAFGIACYFLGRHMERVSLGCIVIDEYAQMTTRPKVGVGAVSRRGAISVYTFDDADEVQRHAKGAMHGESLARILGVEVIDRRLK